jgi:hypothetical protein
MLLLVLSFLVVPHNFPLIHLRTSQLVQFFPWLTTLVLPLISLTLHPPLALIQHQAINNRVVVSPVSSLSLVVQKWKKSLPQICRANPLYTIPPQ